MSLCSPPHRARLISSRCHRRALETAAEGFGGGLNVSAAVPARSICNLFPIKTGRSVTNIFVSAAVARRYAHELSNDSVVDEWCIALLESFYRSTIVSLIAIRGDTLARLSDLKCSKMCYGKKYRIPVYTRHTHTHTHTHAHAHAHTHKHTHTHTLLHIHTHTHTHNQTQSVCDTHTSLTRLT